MKKINTHVFFLSVLKPSKNIEKTTKLCLIRKTETIRPFFYLLQKWVATSQSHRALSALIVCYSSALWYWQITKSTATTALARYLQLPPCNQADLIDVDFECLRRKSWLTCLFLFFFAGRLRLETGLVHRLRVFKWNNDVPSWEVLFPRLQKGTVFNFNFLSCNN